MATDRATIRFGDDLLAELDAYAAEHDMERAAVVRLAVINQIKKKPPKTLPDGVERVGRNPNPAEAGRAGAAARWKKREE